jgi:molecular chaperone DnaK (HSP70)
MKFKNKNTLAEDLLKIIVFQPEIKDVILMGGGTRIPKVQEILKKFLGR